MLAYRRREEDLLLPSRLEFSVTKTDGLSLPPAAAGNAALESALVKLLPVGMREQPTNRLGIPFRSVASDLLTGDLVELSDIPLFLALRASLALDAGGKIAISWVPMPNVTFLDVRGGRQRARVGGIPEGASVMIRVAPSTDEDKPLDVSAPLSFAIAPKMPLFTWRRLLLTGFTLLLAAALWMRSGRSIFWNR